MISPLHADDKMSIKIIGSLADGCNVSDKYVAIVLHEMNSEYLIQCFTIIAGDKTETISINLDSIPKNISANWIIEIRTNMDEIVALQLVIDPHTFDTDTGAMLAAAILILLNVLIVSEVRENRLIIIIIAEII